jgi:uncharacterized damage-inducible protein DinB
VLRAGVRARPGRKGEILVDRILSKESEMSLGADKARAIADYTLADYEYERATTRHVIGAIPAGRENYLPDTKSRTALDLAWHIVRTELLLLSGVCDGQFSQGERDRPAHIRSAQDVLAWYDRNIPSALERTRGLSGQQLEKVVDFFGVMQAPAVSYLTFMVKHSAHHRGQLSAYLRPMGAKVPSIYGPSADTQ